tara:strand:+ start:346 stop:546 length:201 start_codon:yes stop_codon:yes gene_type:complete
MQQVAQISEIIEEILTNNDVENAEEIAMDCAVTLVRASLEQLAGVLGGEINEDMFGQQTIHLGALF